MLVDLDPFSVRGCVERRKTADRKEKGEETVLSELKPYLGKAMTLLLCFFKKDKVERGALADELSLLHGNDDEETNKENSTGLRHVLLSSLSLYRTGTPFNYLEFPTDIVLLAVL